MHSLEFQVFFSHMSKHHTQSWLQLSQWWTQAQRQTFPPSHDSLHSCAECFGLTSGGVIDPLLQLPLAVAVMDRDPPHCSEPPAHPSLQVTACYC